jgi:hypothetical protein
MFPEVLIELMFVILFSKRGIFFGGVLLLVDSLLLVVDCSLFDTSVCGQQCYTYI